MTRNDEATEVPAAEKRWTELARRTMAEITDCEEVYRPTTFWTSGVQTLADDLRDRGLGTFKSWPSAGWWFYPRYGKSLAKASIDAALVVLREHDPALPGSWFRDAIGGAHVARRDYDAVRLAWDQSRWPFDLTLGESPAGSPPEQLQFDASSTEFFTRPYLNYLLVLAGLSRHVDSPPRRFLELGGGFGVLGEIVLSRDREAVYVDLDIPPLLTVASSYLDTLFGKRVTTYEGQPASGPLDVPGSACLPSWRIADVGGPFDVFINSFSFQEMEPDVVARYADDVSRLGVEWVVSLNSRAGKQRKDAEHDVGVLEPVTSAAIVRTFEARGYGLVAAYGEPLLQSRGELAILRRGAAGSAAADDAGRLSAGASADAGASHPAIDLRLPFTPLLPSAKSPRSPKDLRLRRIVRRLVPRALRQRLRGLLPR